MMVCTNVIAFLPEDAPAILVMIQCRWAAVHQKCTAFTFAHQSCAKSLPACIANSSVLAAHVVCLCLHTNTLHFKIIACMAMHVMQMW